MKKDLINRMHANDNRDIDLPQMLKIPKEKKECVIVDGLDYITYF